MASPAARLASIEDALQRVRVGLGKKRRLERRQAEVTPALWATACVVFWKTGPDTAAAWTFLQRARPEGSSWHEDTLDRLRGTLETVPAAERRRCCEHPEGAAETKRQRRALKFLQELRLHEWVGSLNETKGIAPLPSLALPLMEVRSPADAPSPRASPPRPSSRRSRLQWLRRWRRRWAVTLTRFRAGERETPAVATRRATRPGPCWGVPGERKTQPGAAWFRDPRRPRPKKRGARFRSRFWDRLLENNKGWRPENGPPFFRLGSRRADSGDGRLALEQLLAPAVRRGRTAADRELRRDRGAALSGDAPRHGHRTSPVAAASAQVSHEAGDEGGDAGHVLPHYLRV